MTKINISYSVLQTTQWRRSIFASLKRIVHLKYFYHLNYTKTSCIGPLGPTQNSTTCINYNICLDICVETCTMRNTHNRIRQPTHIRPSTQHRHEAISAQTVLQPVVATQNSIISITIRH